jgi:hypothetical protein
LFWIPSLFGVAGLQRIYLGKIGSGILYLLTGGLFGIGTLYDALTLPEQVRHANLQRRLEGPRGGMQDFFLDAAQPEQEEASLEHVILRTAKKNGGSVSPAEVALEANVSADEAREKLEELVGKGFAEMRVRKRSGNLAYVFPEFFTLDTEQEFEEF